MTTTATRLIASDIDGALLHSDVIAVGDEVTRSNDEDGVAVVIERLLDQ